MKPHISLSHTNHGAIKEAVAAFFRDRGFQVVHEVRIRTWRPDIVAVKRDTVIIAEAKGPHGDLRRALAQVALYATDASSAYLAVPAARADARLENAARALGIGLIGVSDLVRIVVEPSAGSPRPVLLRRAKKALGMRNEGKQGLGRRRPPPLHRILKNRSVVDTLISNRKRRFTIRELSIAARTAYSTTWRAVQDLKSLGAVASERVGPSEYLQLNADSSLLNDLIRLRAIDLSPHRAAAQDFARLVASIPEVTKVVLFGSVAEGRETTGSDVDVAVFLSKKKKDSMQRVYEAVSEIQSRTRMRVVPLLVAPPETRLRDQLARAIQAGQVLFERP